MLSDRIRARQSLSKLVAYLNLIDSIETDSRTSEILYLLESLTNEHKLDNIDWASYQPIDNHSQTAIDNILDLKKDFASLREEVFQEIIENEQPYYDASTNFYQYNKDSAEGLESLNSDPDFKEVVGNRINLLTDWQFPGAAFRPQHCEFMRNMVACDPLYLVDTDYDSMLPGIEQFGKRYQRRLCFTETIEYIDTMMETLPSGQIGFILITNFFELRPIELLEKYFIELKKILRPGGRLAFTYNNCDYAKAVSFVELRQRCYTPGRAVIALLEEIGYTVTYVLNHNSGQGYIECKRDGELSTIRGGQSLARPLPLHYQH